MAKFPSANLQAARPLPIVNRLGQLTRVLTNSTHSDRAIEHRKMRMTWLQTFAGFGLLGAVLAAICWYTGGAPTVGIFGCLWLGIMLTAWFFSAKITPYFVQAVPADPETVEGARAIRCADRAWALLIAHVTKHYGKVVAGQLKRPPVMRSANKHANAFCTGRGWHDSVIVIFDGCFLADMSDDEVVAVLGHELGHFFHGDVLMQTIAGIIGALFTLSVVGVANSAIKPFFARMPRLLQWLRWPSYLLLVVVFRISGIIPKVVQAFISRAREASADAFSAEITDDPCSLARALKKLVSYEVKLAKEEAAKQDEEKKQHPEQAFERQLIQTCEHAVLDSLGLLMFVDTLDAVEHAEAAGKPSAWQRFKQHVLEDHPPVEDRCAWLELAAGQACPCPGAELPGVN